MRIPVFVVTCSLLAAIPLGAETLPPAGTRLKKVSVGIHVHSTISTGVREPEEIVRLAKDAGLDGVIITDSARRRWEYGLWPVRHLIKRVVEHPSVLQFGPARYLKTIRALGSGRQSIAVIPGLEVAASYEWGRSPFDRRGGQLRNWHRHLLVFGLEDPHAIAKLPIDDVDPYHGDRGAAPHQRVIDFVREHDALVFWAHPETRHLGHHGKIEDYTEAYPHLLELTRGYHGFAVTYFGKLTFVSAGGLWDKLLAGYSAGERAQPVWIIGELDTSDRKRALNAVVNEMLVREHSADAMLEALGSGRLWVVFHRDPASPRLTLDHVTLVDVGSDRRTTVGGSLESTGPVEIRVVGTRAGTSGRPGEVTLIKDGRVFGTRAIHERRFSVEWTDTSPSDAGFYRIMIEDPSGLVYTNPMFVQSAGHGG